jgi:hypothetical protein
MVERETMPWDTCHVTNHWIKPVMQRCRIVVFFCLFVFWFAHATNLITGHGILSGTIQQRRLFMNYWRRLICKPGTPRPAFHPHHPKKRLSHL